MDQARYLDSTGRLASRRKRRIKTPPVVEAFKRVLIAFNMGCGSSMIVGRPRLGKTYAARWICQSISELLGPISWYEVSFEKSVYASESGFFSLLLKAVDHKFVKRGTLRDLRDRICEFMIERASQSPLGTVILMLDEAQNLREIHWTWLAELSNSVDRAGYSLFTLSTGQKSLYVMKNTLNELASDKDGDFIIGRFFLDMNDFRGLRTLKDITSTLREYDGAPFGPEETILWIEAALPRAFNSGWRLERFSNVIWNAYNDVWRRAGRKDQLEIPMTYFDLLVRQVMASPEKYDVEEPQMGIAQAIELVNQSQFSKSI